jgi:asparagine synthase (glutamine-hydrolysing)
MNLFFLAWNFSKVYHSIVLSELHQMIEVYPHLDPETLWHHSSPCGTVFSASMHTAEQASTPRRYIMEDEKQVVLYSGLPINPNGDFLAHDAKALSAHWERLTDSLEGAYFIVRAIDTPPTIELQTDILGLEHVFYFRKKDLWLLSNSVQLIEKISKPRPLDPVGVSLFLSMGWAGGDHTLRSGIKVVPAGQRWIWQKNDTEPKRQSYYSPARLASRLPKKQTKVTLHKLADNLIQLLNRLGQSFETLISALTGGKDSRLLAALLIRAGVPVQYYTQGDPSGVDAQIAKIIATNFDLSYQIKSIRASDVIRDWEKGCTQIVRQTDGMRPLQLMPSVLAFQVPRVNQLNVRLTGAGGEIARGYYDNSHLYFGKHNVEAVKNFLIKKTIKNYRGTIRQRGIALSRDYVSHFVNQCVDNGFEPLNIPDAFYTYQRVGRRVGGNWRASMSIRDSFSPYCTRAFIEMSFSIPPLQRHTEPLHYSLIHLLSPELHKIPFTKDAWRLQQPIMNALNFYFRKKIQRTHRQLNRWFKINRNQLSSSHIVSDNMYDRLGWFESKRDKLREICLDQESSLIWDLVDRNMFEQITSSNTESNIRSYFLKVLYHIITLFYYEADEQRCLRSSNIKRSDDLTQEGNC